MKTVVEIIDGIPYTFVNTEKHFKRIEKQLRGPRITQRQLAIECDLRSYGDCHIVIEGSPK